MLEAVGVRAVGPPPPPPPALEPPLIAPVGRAVRPEEERSSRTVATKPALPSEVGQLMRAGLEKSLRLRSSVAHVRCNRSTAVSPVRPQEAHLNEGASGPVAVNQWVAEPNPAGRERIGLGGWVRACMVDGDR